MTCQALKKPFGEGVAKKYALVDGMRQAFLVSAKTRIAATTSGVNISGTLRPPVPFPFRCTISILKITQSKTTLYINDHQQNLTMYESSAHIGGKRGIVVCHIKTEIRF
jgi:hypothetical protein